MELARLIFQSGNRTTGIFCALSIPMSLLGRGRAHVQPRIPLGKLLRIIQWKWKTRIYSFRPNVLCRYANYKKTEICNGVAIC